MFTDSANQNSNETPPSNDIFLTEANNLLQVILNDTEENVCQKIQDFILKYGAAVFRDLNFDITLDFSSGETKSNLLFAIIYQKKELVAQLLIDSGVDINEPTTCVNESSLMHHFTPLMMACHFGLSKVAEKLLEKNALLLDVTGNGCNILFLCKTPELIKKLGEQAIKNKCLDDLLSMILPDGLSPLTYHCLDGNSANLLAVFDLEVRNLGYCILEKRETEALACLARIEEVFMSQTVGLLNDRAVNHLRNTNQEIRVPLLSVAIEQSLVNLVIKMLDLGFDPEITTSSKTHPNLRILNQTPLMYACAENNIEVVKILLNKKVDLLKKDNLGRNCLAFCKSMDVLQLILTAAKERDCLESLVANKDKNDKNVHHLYASLGFIDLLQALLALPLPSTPYSPRSLLDIVRGMSYKYLDKFDAFDAIAKKLRHEVVATSHTCFLFMNPLPLATFATSYDILFNDKPKPRLTKEEALRQVYASIHELFNKPEECKKYIAFLNADFKRFYQEQYHGDFPQVNTDTYSFEEIDNTFYPIPNERFVGLNKNSALSKFLILFLRQHGGARQMLKWVGYVPKDKTSQAIIDGDFVTECRFGTGLLHGKVSHMLQHVLIIYAIQSGVIDLTYGNDNEKHTLTIADILDGFMTVMDCRKKAVWMYTRDARVNRNIVFTDPHRLQSIIMYEASALNAHELSNYLIDSFCKGLKRYAKACSDIRQCALTMDVIVSELKDLNIANFYNTPSFFNYSINREKQKGRLAEESETHQKYAIINKEYDLPEFTPATMTPI